MSHACSDGNRELGFSCSDITLSFLSWRLEFCSDVENVAENVVSTSFRTDESTQSMVADSVFVLPAVENTSLVSLMTGESTAVLPLLDSGMIQVLVRTDSREVLFRLSILDPNAAISKQ